MDPEYGARYRRLYERHWWWRARERAIVRLLEKLSPADGFGRILDIGCGDGLFFPQLQRFGEPEGLEVEAALVTEAGRARGTIHVRPFDESFRPPHPFGLITLLDVIEHIEDDVAALSHAASLLAPGGVMVITVPALPWLWTAHDDINHHYRRYTARSLERAARGAGLEVRARHYAFQWLVPLKLLVRMKEKLVSAPPSPAEVPAGSLNRLFYGMCRLEQATWGRLPWPIGSSLVAVLSRRA